MTTKKKKYLRGEVLGEEAVGLDAAASHHDEDVERRLAVERQAMVKRAKTTKEAVFLCKVFSDVYIDEAKETITKRWNKRDHSTGLGRDNSQNK